VDAIQRAGGSVTYDWEWGNYNPYILNTNGKPRAPKWLADRVGVDYVANVISATLVSRQSKAPESADDETMVHVGRLRRLKSLRLSGTEITDAGLAHVAGLTRLRSLQLANMRIGDAGLVHLEGLTSLRSLNLVGSPVTDGSVLALERALPGVRIFRDEDLLIYKSTPRADSDLDFARSRPVRLACSLLVHRARTMAKRGEEAEFVATIEALGELEPGDQLSLVKLAGARSECLALLDFSVTPRLSEARRQALRRACADRGIDALTRAVELGYDNPRRLDGPMWESHALWNLRTHPAFPGLVERVKANRSRR
jgi:hypothetical protein